jgi:hypothetical protein
MIRRGRVNIKFRRPPSDDRGADPRFSAGKVMMITLLLRGTGKPTSGAARLASPVVHSHSSVENVPIATGFGSALTVPGHVSAGTGATIFGSRNGKECDQLLWGRFVYHRRTAWLWFYGSLPCAVTAKRRPQKLSPPRLAARMKP